MCVLFDGGGECSDDHFRGRKKGEVSSVWEGLEPVGTGQEPRGVTLVFGVLLQEGLGEGSTDDFPADIR